MKDSQLISIIGPTASGKTSSTLALAKYLNQKNKKQIHVISADSRQIYQDTPILTGADVPKKFHQLTNKNFKYPYFLNQEKTIALHGISMLSFNQSWSVGHFQEMSHQIINNTPKAQYYLIVGGTGLYHRHLLNLDEHVRIMPNPQFRKKAEHMTLTELQQQLNKVNPKELARMNNSDKNNPRRLIRAIEIQTYFKKNDGQQRKKTNFHVKKHTFIGLNLDTKKLKKKIRNRIETRLTQGVISEVKQTKSKIEKYLLKTKNKKLQITTSLGFNLICDYLNKKISMQELKKKWSREEYQYAQRQITWFKKNKKIHWLQAENISIQDMIQFI